MTRLTTTAIALSVGLLGQLAQADEPQHGDFASRKLKVGDTERVYRLVVPDSVDLSKPAPLVISFHGILIDSKDVMPLYTRLSRSAKQHGFVLAYPNAINRAWGIMPEKVKQDLAFFDALVERLSDDYKIDSDRVYVMGMSNGGYFAHLVGAERSETVAAVASHSGPLGLQTLLGGIDAKRKFPVLIAHGDKDPLFGISIARENRDKYEAEGHEVEYVELEDVGHEWGTKYRINDTIWKFFDEHPLEKK